MSGEERNSGGEMPPDVANSALRGAGIGLWDYSVPDNKVYYDQGFCRLLDLTPDQLGHDASVYEERMERTQLERVAVAVQDHLDGKTEGVRVEIQIRRGDGESIWLETCGQVTERDADGNPLRLVGTVQDCTRRREAELSRRSLEQQLEQVQRMESVGALVGGIAHDFNNVLLAIAGQTELAIADLQEAEYGEVEESLTEIRDAAARAADMTKRLLSFGRPTETAWQVVDMAHELVQMQPTLRRLVPASIEFEIDVGKVPLWVHADTSRIQQTLINICANAVEAIEQRGKIRLEAKRVGLAPVDLSAYPWASPGSYVCISLEDDGVGIPESVISRVFDPFFTTKEVGEGTGLGLSVAYSAAKQHGGVLRVQSQTERTATKKRPRGTRFEMFLPESVRVPVKANASDDTPAANAPKGRTKKEGGAVILVAEDDAPVRKVVERMLQGAGYRVISACDGAEAVELFAKHEFEIDLVLLDAIMPNKTGREVYEEIMATRPELKVMFASGYTADVLDHSFFERERRPLLAKPFTREVLLDKVAEILDA